MAKLDRIIQKIFASQAGSNERGQIGSLAAGTPTFTNDPEEIQDLGNFEDGLFGVVVGANSPAIEDINSLYFLITRQIAYLLQSGIAEYKNDEIYYTGSGCRDEENLYFSKIDDNEGEDLEDKTKWEAIPFDIYERVKKISLSNFIPLAGISGDTQIELATGSGSYYKIAANESTIIITIYSRRVLQLCSESIIIDKKTGVASLVPLPRDAYECGILQFEGDKFFYPTTGGTSGGSYSATNAIMYYDGASWLQADASIAGEWSRVRYLEGSYFCVGEIRTDSKCGIMTSSDGLAWSTNSSAQAITGFIRDIAYGNGLYVAAGDDSIVLTSGDGVTWTEAATSGIGTGDIGSIVFFKGYFYVLKNGAGSPTGGVLLRSADGINWTDLSVSFSSGQDLIICDGVLVAQAEGYAIGDNYRIESSIDGQTWQSSLSSIVSGANVNTIGCFDGSHYIYGKTDDTTGNISLISSLSI